MAAGGNGGSAGVGLIGAPTVGVAIGGNGGSGGTSGTVDVNATASIVTAGDKSYAILAQSIGGGGGTGGLARRAGFKDVAQSVSVLVGGKGGSGNTSSNVSASSSGLLLTTGEEAHGIVAQSIGGGGGEGGSTFIFEGMKGIPSESATNRLSVALGGDGGTGNTSGDVAVTNTGAIGTESSGAVGILAQSVGGGGGHAGSTYKMSIQPGTEGSASNDVSFSMGGNGGTGAAAGDVTVNNRVDTTGIAQSGLITTIGSSAHGIVAMSIGGGGGHGGMSTSVVAGLKTSAENPPMQANLNLGGAGGAGGTGGNVTVTNEGAITTYGDEAHGINALSVGGGGGDGGMATSVDLRSNVHPFNFNGKIGGSGGTGNTAGDVVVTNAEGAAIAVYGDRSIGIKAQSVGGGGGNAGFALGLAGSVKGNVVGSPVTEVGSSLIKMGVGGKGGAGGDAGNVTVNNHGDILVAGKDGHGIYAQSVGGGGGKVSGRLPNILSSILWATEYVVELLAGGDLDGDTANDGEAGSVTINNTGNIYLVGDNSRAIFHQAVSGGGGDIDLLMDLSQNVITETDVANPPGAGGQVAEVKGYVKLGAQHAEDQKGTAVQSSQAGSVSVVGNNSQGQALQSIGGGGGSNRTQVALADRNQRLDLVMELGGKDVEGSTGGSVTADRIGAIQAEGRASQGGVTQSIGGGGGFALVDVTTATPDSAQSRVRPTANTVASQASMEFVLGSEGGEDNDGGAVNYDGEGSVSTLGDYSPGLVIQSIGAGGGEVIAQGLTGVLVTMGGTDGAEGDGGKVEATNGTVSTDGIRSHGLVVQSIGGGGGVVITDEDADVTLEKSGSRSGSGGEVDVASGSVLTGGSDSIGLLAQSIGGGGGVVNTGFVGSSFGDGSASDVAVIVVGDVVTSGEKSIGVYGQSQARSAVGDVDITIQGHVYVSGERALGVKGDTSSLESEVGSIAIAVSGSVEAAGDVSQGIDGFVASAQQVNKTPQISIAGSLVASGEKALGARAGASADVITQDSFFDVDGSIAATGLQARGLSLTFDGKVVLGDLLLRVGQSILASGGQSVAAEVSLFASDSAAAINIGVDGNVMASGEGAIGILSRLESSTLTGALETKIGGIVEASGSSSVGLQLSVDTHSSSVVSEATSSAARSGSEPAPLVTPSLAFSVGGVSASGNQSVGVALSRLGGDENAGDSVSGSVAGGVSASGLGAKGVIMNVHSGGEVSSAGLAIAGGISASGFGSVGASLAISSTTSLTGAHAAVSSVWTGGAYGTGLAVSAIAKGYSGGIDVFMRGSAVAFGNKATGVSLWSQAGEYLTGSRLSVGGDVKASGSGAVGVEIYQISGGVITSSATSILGNVITTADDATALRQYISAGSYVYASSAEIAGLIHVDADKSTGVSWREVAAYNGRTGLNVGGSINAVGTNATGMDVFEFGRHQIGLLNLNIGGNVYSNGDQAIGLDWRQRTGGDGSVYSADMRISSDVIARGINGAAIRGRQSAKSIGMLALEVGGSVWAEGEGLTGIDLSQLASQRIGVANVSIVGSVVAKGMDTAGLSISRASNGALGNLNGFIGGDVLAAGSGARGLDLDLLGVNSALRWTLGGALLAHGDAAKGIEARLTSSGDTYAHLSMAGPVETDGLGAIGVDIDATLNKAFSSDVVIKDHILVLGAESVGLNIKAYGASLAEVAVDAGAALVVSGDQGRGVQIQMDASAIASDVSIDGITLLGSSSRGVSVRASESKGPIYDDSDLFVSSIDANDWSLDSTSFGSDADMLITTQVRNDILIIADNATALEALISGGIDSQINHDIGGDTVLVGDGSTGFDVTVESSVSNWSGLKIGGDLQLSGDGSTGAAFRYGGTGLVGTAIDVAGDVVVMGEGARGITWRADNVGSASLDIYLGNDLYALGQGALGVEAVMIGAQGSALVNFDITGNALAEGDGARIIRLEASDADTNGFIEISEEEVWFAKDGASLIETAGSFDLTLVNNGAFIYGGDTEGAPYRGGSGRDVIHNYGYYEGNLFLGDGANRFINHEGGILYSGLLVDLDNDGSTLFNYGSFVLGDASTPDVGTLVGNVEFGDTGTWFSVIDFNTNKADRLDVSGTAYLSGTLDMGLLSPEKILPGKHQIKLINAQSGDGISSRLAEDADTHKSNLTEPLAGLGDVTLTVPDSLIMDFGVFEDAGLFTFDYDLDFAPNWLSTSRQIVGEHFNSIQINDSSEALADTIVGLLFTKEATQIEGTYDLVSPEIYSRLISQQINEAVAFTDRLARCERYDGLPHAKDRAECFWVSAGKVDFDLDFNGEWADLDHDGENYSLGGQRLVSDGIWLGLAASRSNGSSVLSNLADVSSGEAHQLGAMLRTSRFWGLDLGGALALGFSSQDVSRNMMLERDDRSQATRSSHWLSGRVFLEQTQQRDRWRFTPALDGGYSQVLAESVYENTNSVWGLDLGSEKRKQWWVRPRIEVNYEAPFGDSSRVGIDVSIGRRVVLSEKQVGGGATMLVAPEGVSPMYTRAFVDDALWESEFGVYWMTRSGFQIKASYGNTSGEYRTNEEARVSFSIPLR